jgi:hypothetical protein
MVLFIGNIQNRHICKDRNQISGCLGLGVGLVGGSGERGISFGDDENILKLIIVVIVQWCNHTKNH